MKIRNILEELRFADTSAQLICVAPADGLKSRIDIVGQVLENIPGVLLCDREPYLREKTVGTFIRELKTFGERFVENDFFMTFDYKTNDETYEMRHYKLTHIKQESGEIVLYSEDGEYKELRSTH